MEASKQERPSNAAATDPNQAVLLECLSERLLRHSGVSLWRQVFLGFAYETIRFETERLTFVATDDPSADINHHEAALLAKRLGARLEPAAGVGLMLTCREPAAALKAALLVQRLCGSNQARTALNTAECAVACFELAGESRRVVIGREIERAAAAARKAASGTVVLCRDTFNLIGDDFSEQVQQGLISVEIENETVTQVSITLSPYAGSTLSAFGELRAH
jgi:hypothetical protein